MLRFPTAVLVLTLLASVVRAEDIEVVSVIEGDRGPGFKAAANVMGAVGPKHVVDFTIIGFTVRDKTTGKPLRHQSQLEFWQQVQPAKSLDPSPRRALNCICIGLHGPELAPTSPKLRPFR